MQLQVGPELKPPIRVRNGQSTLHVVRHGLAGGVRKIVYGQDDDVVAHADAAVLASVAVKRRGFQIDAHVLTSVWS